MDIHQKCRKAVEEILQNQSITLCTWFMQEFIPDTYKTNTIKNNINILNKLNKENVGFAMIQDQLNKVYRSIYMYGAWKISNVIKSFPKECRTPELYLEIFKQNKCILIYTPYKLRKFLNIDLAYDNCKYSPDGTCLNCARSFEIPCSFSYVY